MLSSSSIQQLMKEVDAKFPSPNDRAQHIHKVLKEHDPDASMWDIACFCVEMLNVISLDPALQPVIGESVKSLSRQVYSIHYFNSEELFGAGLEARRIRERSSSATDVSDRGSSDASQTDQGSSNGERASSSEHRLGHSSKDDDEDNKGNPDQTAEQEAQGNAGDAEGGNR